MSAYNKQKIATSKRWCLLFPNSFNRIELYVQNQVIVHYDNRFSASSDTSLSTQIDLAWQAILQRSRLQKSEKPTDVPKFRLASVNFESGKILLRLGPTTYKNYIAIRTTPTLMRQIKARGRKLGIEISKFLPNVVGNAALIITKDCRSIAVIRSERVSVYKNYLDLPGGHPEPRRIEKYLWYTRNKKNDLENRICNELFSSILGEIEEDIGIQPSLLSLPKLFVILQNKTNVMKPDMIFVVRTDLNSSDIHRRGLQNSKNSKEVKGIVVFDPLEPENELKRYRMTPIMEGVLFLLQKTWRRLRIPF